MKKINTDLANFIDFDYINKLIKVIDSQEVIDIELSWNSYGGSVYAGMQFSDYLNTSEKELTANVTGIVASMGAVLLPFFKRVKGSKQSDIMIHSATSDGNRKLKENNNFLYEALSKKIDESKFKAITGKDLKEVMFAENDERIDVWLTGAEAYEIGLYDELTDLVGDMKASLNDIESGGLIIPDTIAKKHNLINTNDNKMDIKNLKLDELITGNSSLVNEIKEDAIKEERLRISAIAKYLEYDSDKALALINSGKQLSIEDAEYFLEIKAKAKVLKDLEDKSANDIEPKNNVQNTEINQEQEKFINALHNIKK